MEQIKEIISDLRGELKVLVSAMKVDDVKRRPSVIIEKRDAQQFWARYFPNDQLVKWILFESALSNYFSKDEEVQSVQAAVFPQLQKILVVDAEGHTTVFSFNEIFKKTGIDTLRELILNVNTIKKHSGGGGAAGAGGTTAGSSGGNNKEENQQQSVSDAERVFFLKIRHGETFKLRDEYLDVGFVLVRNKMTLVDVRKLIIAAHEASDDDDDEDDDEEDEEQLEFLANGKFTFGVRKTETEEQESLFFRVKKKQEKQFQIKELTDNDICIFEQGVPHSKLSSEKMPLPGAVNTEEKAVENRAASKASVSTTGTAASSGTASDSHTQQQEKENKKTKKTAKNTTSINADDDDEIEAVDISDFPWLKKNLLSSEEVQKNNSSADGQGTGLVAGLESLMAASQQTFTQYLTLEQCLRDDELSHQLRRHAMHEMGVQEETVLFLQRLEGLKKTMEQKYISKMMQEYKFELDKIKDEFLEPKAPAALEGVVYSDRRKFEEDPLLENPDVRFLKAQEKIWQQFMEPELSGFNEARKSCEEKLDVCLKCLKTQHNTSTAGKLCKYIQLEFSVGIHRSTYFFLKCNDLFVLPPVSVQH